MKKVILGLSIILALASCGKSDRQVMQGYLDQRDSLSALKYSYLANESHTRLIKAETTELGVKSKRSDSLEKAAQDWAFKAQMIQVNLDVVESNIEDLEKVGNLK